jgi:toxin HigB-1
MEVEFLDKELAKAESDGSFPGRFSADIRKAFFKRLQLIRAAKDERDFYAMKSLHFEKLKGDRADERSMRLNDQWRLILKIRPADPKATVIICGIEDYH